MTPAPGMASAHPETAAPLAGNREHKHHVKTLDQAVRIIAEMLLRESFVPDARRLIGEGAELEYKIIIRERPDIGGMSAKLDKYVRTSPLQICYFGGLA